MTTTAENTQTAAQEILAQLGGNKFLTMTGSFNIYSDNQGNTLSMHLRKNTCKAKYLRITLTSMDLYTMEFFTVDKEFNKTVKVKHEGVYGDMLQTLFTKATGLYTSL